MSSSADPELTGPARLTGASRMAFLARDTAFYGAAAITNKAFFLITLPFLTRYFGVDRYGLIDFLYVLVLFLTAVVVLGQTRQSLVTSGTTTTRSTDGKSFPSRSSCNWLFLAA